MNKTIRSVVEALGSPITFLSTFWLKNIIKMKSVGINDKIFMSLGILPVPDHYRQPLINPKKHLTKPLDEPRQLKAIDFNIEGQLELLSRFNYNEELIKIPLEKKTDKEFYYNNNSYASGDAEYLYNIIRHFKPKRIVEIGSGNSTLMAINAIKTNAMADPAYKCEHICIEPYEMPWLEDVDVKVIREKVEDLEMSFFQQLEANDILFIDSSHIIRPQGDVLFEFLEILPILKPGVLVHIHDIFTPRDYLEQWIVKNHFLWNEQYLLEAFLSFNSEFEIIAALNFLSHNYKAEFSAKNPVYASQPGREPGAFWIRRN